MTRLHSKIILIILLLWVAATFLMIEISMDFYHFKDKQELIGKTLYKVNGIDDPFEEIDTTFYLILDIKDGYIKYKNLKYDNIYSSKAMWFLKYKKVLKNEK